MTMLLTVRRRYFLFVIRHRRILVRFDDNIFFLRYVKMVALIFWFKVSGYLPSDKILTDNTSR